MLRKSHENPAIQTIYKEFLGEPNRKKSHELLHTKYIGRGLFNELSDESFVVEPEKPVKRTHVKVSPLAVQITRQEVTQSSKRENTVDSAQLLALEAENRRLRKEAEEHEETVRLLKEVIKSYVEN